jgi:propanol-preferring alcohol dehydrogenase
MPSTRSPPFATAFRFAFTGPATSPAQAFARRLGCEWAGGADALPPDELDAAILFAPVGALVPAALRAIRPGGMHPHERYPVLPL